MGVRVKMGIIRRPDEPDCTEFRIVCSGLSDNPVQKQQLMRLLLEPLLLQGFWVTSTPHLGLVTIIRVESVAQSGRVSAVFMDALAQVTGRQVNARMAKEAITEAAVGVVDDWLVAGV
jgi:hypothetical protein